MTQKVGASQKPWILITGASGGLARIVVRLLSSRYNLVGADPRALADPKAFPGEFHQIDYRQRKMSEIFRSQKFKALLHLGRVPLGSGERKSVRFNLNVLGTKNLLELSLKYGVENVVVCSTFHVYGAHQHNHLHITEDDPLRASQLFPELSDAVELDNVSTAFLLRNRDRARTVILRPANIIGPSINNRISRVLRSRFCPVLLGYDPILQFIHEEDFARAMELCLKSDHSGVYNVAGEGVVPFTRAIELAGGTPVPIPAFLAYRAAGALTSLGSPFGLNFPRHLVDYFKYPTVISDAAFRKDFGYEPRVSTVESLLSVGGADGGKA